MKLQDTPNALIKFFSLDYAEIPDVLAEAEKNVPKYKGSVQPYQAAFLYWLTMQYVPTYGNILEIGTGLGYTAYIMAKAKIKTVIDTLTVNEKEFEIASKVSPSNVIVSAISSREYYNAYPEVKYDLIFIDGNHNDIAFDCRWYGRLKENGIIVFHDYSSLDSWSPQPMVYDYLNKMKEVWGEPLHEVFDDGNVGMAVWQKSSDSV